MVACPVGVVVGDAVAGVTHLKDQLLDPGNVSIDFLGRLLAGITPLDQSVLPLATSETRRFRCPWSRHGTLQMALMAHYKWQMVSFRQAFS